MYTNAFPEDRLAGNLRLGGRLFVQTERDEERLSDYVEMRKAAMGNRHGPVVRFRVRISQITWAG